MKESSILFLTIFAITLSAPVFAGDMGEMGEMTPEEMEMMKNFEAYSTPNAMHEKLAKMAGSWDAKVQHWMAPGAPAEESMGTAESEAIFGGRFIKQEFNSEWMGQPFQGMGLFGYDNIQKEFQSIWLDSMATGMMVSSGELAEDGSVEEEGTFSCPLTNSERWNRSKTTFVDEDTWTFEMFMEDESGEEFRSMLITYTRRG
ncbi:MAG: DUF1579 domain-containing protein [Candidatus Omnitrophica bacterium]|nr:DUF1579 domain-containing protein [Candidatus Omnitrophota bacterium]